MTGVVLRHLGRDGRRARALPRLREEPRAHAARHPQPSPRRARRAQTATRRCRQPPVPLDHASCPDAGAGRARARRLGQARSTLGEKHGYRNAQATVIAPTGTIGLVMDCDTTGIEPDFALVKFKKLAGGGYFKIINRAVPEALRTLGYTREPRSPRSRPTPSATARSTRRPAINHDDAEGQGLHRRGDRQGREGAADRLRHQVRLQQLDARRRLLPRHARHRRRAARRAVASTCWPRSASPRREIEAANIHVCGAMTLEGAPHLKAEHYPVFDCANPVRQAPASAISRSRATSA